MKKFDNTLARRGWMSSKHTRTLEAIFEDPVRANILWDDVVAMLRHKGAHVVEREGSRVAISLGGATAVLHRPHPQKEIKRSMVRDLRDFLTLAGLEP